MVDIVKNGIRKFSAYYMFQMHNHNHYEIIYVLGGQCIMAIGDFEVALKIGDCILIDCNANHKFYVNDSKGCKINQLEITADTTQMSNCYYKLSDCKQVDNCLNNIIVFQNEKTFKSNSTHLIELEINKTLLIIDSLRSAQHENSIGKHVAKMIQYIKLNDYCDIDLCKFSKEIGISDRYMRKMFEKQVGVNPQEYLTSLRMEKAKKLLSYTKEAVALVAVESGYNTVQYFSKVFKQEIGLTPTEFRNYQLKIKSIINS